MRAVLPHPDPPSKQSVAKSATIGDEGVMCVLAFAWLADDRWPLVLIGNRDERHERPSAPLDWWTDKQVLAGRDLVSGGTWLGVSDTGVAVVTNFATGQPATARSRGALVPDFLLGDGAAQPDARFAGFNAFNLVTFGRLGARFVSNHPVMVQHALAPGLRALANGGMDERVFRADAAKSALSEWLAGGGDDPEPLFTALRKEQAPADQPVPIFIRDPVYGTRCSTIVMIDATGQGHIAERCFDADGALTGEGRFTFELPLGINRARRR